MRATRVGLFKADSNRKYSFRMHVVSAKKQSTLNVNSISIGSHHSSLPPFSAIDSIDSQLRQLIFFQEQSITAAITKRQKYCFQNIIIKQSTKLNQQIIQIVLLHHVLQRHWKCISIVYHRRMSFCGKSRIQFGDFVESNGLFVLANSNACR